MTLAELLAGVDKRMGRWLGSVRVHGRRRAAPRRCATRSCGADLDLAAAARAGADLDPDLVFRAFAYAIHPAWTSGHRFTVAQEIADPRAGALAHRASATARRVAVERRAAAGAAGRRRDDVAARRSRTCCAASRAPSGERPRSAATARPSRC